MHTDAEPKILASRDRISGAAAWTEHLCLQKDASGGYKMFTGRYEELAYWEDFYDEETGDYTVPDEIDGCHVVTIEGSYIVGGDLEYYEEDQAITFKRHDEEHVGRWLKATGWYSKIDPVKLRFVLWKM
jgi:hypothetical protein